MTLRKCLQDELCNRNTATVHIAVKFSHDVVRQKLLKSDATRTIIQTSTVTGRRFFFEAQCIIGRYRSVPRQSWTNPVMMMSRRAASLAYVNKSCTLIDHFTSSALTAVNITNTASHHSNRLINSIIALTLAYHTGNTKTRYPLIMECSTEIYVVAEMIITPMARNILG